MEKKKFGIWKILLIILILLLILGIVLLIRPIKNFNIIKDLQEKMTTHVNSTNYHIKSVQKELNGVIITQDYYHKDNKRGLFTETSDSGEISKLLLYNNGERTDMFIETSGEKSVKLDTGMPINMPLYNGLEMNNKWQTFLACFSAEIEEIEYDGKSCYSIKGVFSPDVMYGVEENGSYIEKDTGLEIFHLMDGVETKKMYEFDNVEDSIFVEPNIGEYKLIREE